MLLAPTDYGLNHSEWRPGQLEMIEWAYGQMLADSKVIGVCQAATGSGKTTLPRALSHQYKTVALVRTKSLQADNYERGYAFSPIYGRNAYDCVHDDAEEWAKADDCIFSEQGMAYCPHGQIVLHPESQSRLADSLGKIPAPCPYVLARENAKTAQRAVLNYAYWLHTYEKWPRPAALVCDEGHQLSEQTLDWAGCTVSEKLRQQWRLMPFPMIRGGGGLLTQVAPATERAIGWIEQSLVTLRAAHEKLSVQALIDEKARKQSRQCELLGKKLKATCEALQSVPEDWYIKSGPGVHNGQSAFVARPLTAKHHFKRYFINPAWHLFIMSATIGNPEVFAEELGLEAYEHYSVPSVFATEQRPVMALDVPSMGRGVSDKELNKQADEIARVIKACPPDWSGIIHVTTIKGAPELAQRLARRGLQDRVWVAPTGIGTEAMVREWQNRQQRTPGSLNISWTFWEGYDGKEEKISIVAKVPYPSLGDEYEVARRNYSAKLYLQRAAWQAEQGLGRSRRGRVEDYDTPTERRGLVAIADGAWRNIKSYFSESLRQSIVKN